MNYLLSLNLTDSVVAVLDVVKWAPRSGLWVMAPFLGGLLIVLLCIRGMMKKRVNWMPVTARLLNCKVVVVGNRFFRSRWTVKTHYRYCYEVNGRTYESSKTVSEHKDPFFSGGEHARRIADQGDLRIFYNPQRPTDSVLKIPAKREVGAV